MTIRSPILIVGCPRSGTTLLYNLLSEVPTLWSIGIESKAIIERYHHPQTKSWESGALDADDLTPYSRDRLLRAFHDQAAPGTFWQRFNSLRSRMRRSFVWQSLKQRGQTTAPGGAVSSGLPEQGMAAVRVLVRVGNWMSFWRQGQAIRLLDKSPEHCLRLPFLLALFPDAYFLFLIRDGRSNVNSLLEGWRQPYLFPGYRVPDKLNIPGDRRGRWAFTLIPGWRDLASSPLEAICARQWIVCNEAALGFRERFKGQVPFLTVRYEDLVARPDSVLTDIAAFAGIDPADTRWLGRTLPHVNVVSAPEQNKWRRQNREAIERIMPIIQPMQERLGYVSNS